ncbi:enoyl-CoA hydratase [Candidatus Spongiihabitans sp.]|uniref:enoyl-CoA hydratase n=1 Tax=Candidatus Spongiihabitans sp. TaxID=3101308 RepID=UPI003C6F2705
MTYKTIIAEIDETIGLITLNRPQVLNALSNQLGGELTQALSDFENNHALGAIVITGNEKAFAAGADIAEMKDQSYIDAYQGGATCNLEDALSKCRKPVIAAVSGYALGGGCELAMMCDFIIASESAKFGQPEINLGILPGWGGTQRLTRLIGKSKAMDMCLTGRMMDAAEAERCGLVSRVVEKDKFMDQVISIAKLVASKSLPALMMNKECINQAMETSLHDGLLFERRQFQAAFATADQKEGMAAFVEKRKPHWMHR